jgi:hypothetical protein
LRAFEKPDPSNSGKHWMLLRRLFIAVVAIVITAHSHAADRVQTDAMAARFPHGMPWKVELVDLHGKRLGTIDMRVTSVSAHSCMGDVADGLRVEFEQPNTLSRSLPITSYGIATFSGDQVVIDLSGGTCDAYLVMKGAVQSNGSSWGRVYTFGSSGERDVATYRASIPFAHE